jgi:hypothetical protein
MELNLNETNCLVAEIINKEYTTNSFVQDTLELL